MKSLPVTVRRIGNSLGIVLRKPRKAVRSGWAEAAKSLAIQSEDELLMGEFGNAADLELEW